MEPLERLLELELALCHLQIDLLAYIAQLHHGYAGGCLGGAYLVAAFKPVPHGYLYQYAYVPYAGKLAFKPIEDIGVAHHVSAGKCHMGQSGGADEATALAAQFDGVLEHLYLWARSIGCVGCFIGLCYDRGECLHVLVGEGYLPVHGQTAELAEHHLGQRQAVLDLGELHVGLVDLDIDLESVGLGSHALSNHLLHILAELLDQVAIALGQLLLLAQRHHEPVGLVYVVEGGLPTQFEVTGSHLLADVCHLVGCDDGAAHKDGLSHHDCSRPDVLGVGAEGVVDRLAQLVASLSQLWRELVEHAAQLLCQLGRDDALLNQPRYHLGDIAAHGSRGSRSQRPESGLLVAVEQRYLFAEILIAAHGIDFGQILGAHHLAVVSRHILLEPCHIELLVVAQRQSPTTVERQPLRLNLWQPDGT